MESARLPGVKIWRLLASLPPWCIANLLAGTGFVACRLFWTRASPYASFVYLPVMLSCGAFILRRQKRNLALACLWTSVGAMSACVFLDPPAPLFGLLALATICGLGVYEY